MWVLPDLGVEAFFLNACGSLGFAEKLVERGAAAGAATTRAVFGETAGRVGCNWARLLAHGWAVERALDVARSVDDPAGYVAVGDGTHFLTEPENGLPPEVKFRRTGSGDMTQVELDYTAPRKAGFWSQNRLSTSTALSGTTQAYNVETERLQYAFEDLEGAVRYEDRLHWEIP